jgi:hypothetical protein
VSAETLRPHVGLILESLRHTRRAFLDHSSYPSPEFKNARVAEVDEAISAVIALRTAGSEGEGEAT